MDNDINYLLQEFITHLLDLDKIRINNFYYTLSNSLFINNVNLIYEEEIKINLEGEATMISEDTINKLSEEIESQINDLLNKISSEGLTSEEIFTLNDQLNVLRAKQEMVNNLSRINRAMLESEEEKISIEKITKRIEDLNNGQ